MSPSRTTPGPRRLGACLPDHLRGALNRRADEDSRLRQAWQACVAEPLASHARAVRYTAGVLQVHVDTSAWASRLRYQQPALVERLRRNPLFADLTELRARVIPPDAPGPAATAPEASRSTRLSPEAARAVGRTAAAIDNPELRAALERLARSAERSAPPKRRP